jgi:hypothetical protein
VIWLDIRRNDERVLPNREEEEGVVGVRRSEELEVVEDVLTDRDGTGGVA